MEIIETDLAEGHRGRPAAWRSLQCVELAFRPSTRHAIADFFHRRRAS